MSNLLEHPDLNPELSSYERVSKLEPAYPPHENYPEREVSELFADLSDPDVETRIHAVYQLGRTFNFESDHIFVRIPRLIKHLKNETEAPVRTAIASVLRVAQSPSFLTPNVGDRDKALEKKQNKLYDQTRDALAQMLKHEADLVTRQTVAESLALLATDSHVRRVFSSLWHDERETMDPFILMVTAPHVAQHFIKSFHDDALKQLEDALIQALHDYQEIENLTKQAIVRAGVDRGIPYILKALWEAAPDDSRTHQSTCTLLGISGTAKAIPPLTALLRSDDMSTSRAAIRAFTYLKHPDGVEPLKTFLKEVGIGDPRTTAIEQAIIDCGDAGDIKQHIATLTNPRSLPRQQQLAIQALGKAGGDEPVQTLTTYLRTVEDKNLAGNAFNALTKHPSENVARAIIDRVCDGALGYRQAAIYFAREVQLVHAIHWLNHAVDTRAVPEALPDIEKDRELLKRF